MQVVKKVKAGQLLSEAQDSEEEWKKEERALYGLRAEEVRQVDFEGGDRMPGMRLYREHKDDSERKLRQRSAELFSRISDAKEAKARISMSAPGDLMTILEATSQEEEAANVQYGGIGALSEPNLSADGEIIDDDDDDSDMELRQLSAPSHLGIARSRHMEKEGAVSGRAVGSESESRIAESHILADMKRGEDFRATLNTLPQQIGSVSHTTQNKETGGDNTTDSELHQMSDPHQEVVTKAKKGAKIRKINKMSNTAAGVALGSTATESQVRLAESQFLIERRKSRDAESETPLQHFEKLLAAEWAGLYRTDEKRRKFFGICPDKRRAASFYKNPSLLGRTSSFFSDKKMSISEAVLQRMSKAELVGIGGIKYRQENVPNGDEPEQLVATLSEPVLNVAAKCDDFNTANVIEGKMADTGSGVRVGLAAATRDVVSKDQPPGRHHNGSLSGRDSIIASRKKPGLAASAKFQDAEKWRDAVSENQPLEKHRDDSLSGRESVVTSHKSGSAATAELQQNMEESGNAVSENWKPEGHHSDSLSGRDPAIVSGEELGLVASGELQQDTERSRENMSEKQPPERHRADSLSSRESNIATGEKLGSTSSARMDAASDKQLPQKHETGSQLSLSRGSGSSAPSSRASIIRDQRPAASSAHNSADNMVEQQKSVETTAAGVVSSESLQTAEAKGAHDSMEKIDGASAKPAKGEVVVKVAGPEDKLQRFEELVARANKPETVIEKASTSSSITSVASVPVRGKYATLTSSADLKKIDKERGKFFGITPVSFRKENFYSAKNTLLRTPGDSKDVSGLDMSRRSIRSIELLRSEQQIKPAEPEPEEPVKKQRTSLGFMCCSGVESSSESEIQITVERASANSVKRKKERAGKS